tara:strand:+ start:337 stop:492 length:156 start_codon:yes stop_codon:yes gene_type:complete
MKSKNKLLSFKEWIDDKQYNTSTTGYIDKLGYTISLDALWKKWHNYKEVNI